MACDKCDPDQEYRDPCVDLITIPIPAISSQNNEQYYFVIEICKHCGQSFNIPRYARKY